MKVEFVLRVTVEAESAQEAYDALAEHVDSLEGPIVAWAETYAVDGGEPQDTEDLFLGGKED